MPPVRRSFVAVLTIIVLILVFRLATSTTRAAASDPQVSFTPWNGGTRLIVFYPDQKKVYAYKEDGSCDKSWTLDAPGTATPAKCK